MGICHDFVIYALNPFNINDFQLVELQEACDNLSVIKRAISLISDY